MRKKNVVMLLENYGEKVRAEQAVHMQAELDRLTYSLASTKANLAAVERKVKAEAALHREQEETHEAAMNRVTARNTELEYMLHEARQEARIANATRKAMEDTLRQHALEWASRGGGGVDTTVKRAQAYYEFLTQIVDPPVQGDAAHKAQVGSEKYELHR